MIRDALQNFKLYTGFHPRLEQAAQFITNEEWKTLEPGKYEIDGDNIFALVQHYETKPREQGLWEAHERYMDIQFMAEGEESFGYAPIGQAVVTQPYDTDSDYALYDAAGDFFILRQGHFILAAPQDVHMPCLAVDTPQPVKKIVIKVKV
ncbi:YhcH/YjgK/YiaL family protein [Paenibacillus sp. GXUN7292]|uniref:YhcH/YjgK/YiaL family protein n=1 Tax=Paenibacillus sp. GXUN7292 TaxID=3422499 RepID=UPI003D7EF86A